MLLELETEFIENIARQAGFEFRLEDQERRVVLELSAEGRQGMMRRQQPSPAHSRVRGNERNERAV